MLVHFSFIQGGGTVVIPAEDFHQHFRLKKGEVPRISGVLDLFGPINNNIQIAFDPKTPGRIETQGTAAAITTWHNTTNHVFFLNERNAPSKRFHPIICKREIVVRMSSVNAYNFTLDYLPVKGELIRSERLQVLAEQRRMVVSPPPGETGHIMRQPSRMGSRSE